MLKISVAIITYNEEHNIARCLTSVQGIADEIVVVDSCSTDKTEQVCATFGVRFISQPFLGYIDQKNFAISQARNEWVLSLDADEALSDTLRASIADLKKRTELNADAFSFSRLSSYCGQWIKHGGWYPDRKIRLFDRKKAFFAGVNPHDKIEVVSGAKVELLKGDLLHYTYFNITEHIQQTDRFTAIMAEDLFKKGKRTNFLKIAIKPRIRFIRDFILHGGFLDGYYGFVIARISAHAVFLREIRLKEHWSHV